MICKTEKINNEKKKPCAVKLFNCTNVYQEILYIMCSLINVFKIYNVYA